MDVPIQFFQSILALELAIAGALLFQIRFFEPRQSAKAGDPDRRGSWLRLLMAVVIGATVVGALDAMAHEGGSEAAIAVTIGVALSLLPILARVLPPLAMHARPGGGYSYSAVTIVGLVLYLAAVLALVLLLDR